VPKPQWRLWSSVLVLAGCDTACLYDARPGINWPIATLSLCVGLAAFGANTGRKYCLHTVLALVLACLLSVGAALTADRAYDLVIAGSVLFALGSAVVSTGTERHQSDGRTPSVFAAPFALALVAREASERITETAAAVRGARNQAVIRGVATALPLTVALALLLSASDPIFAAARDIVVSDFLDFSILPRGLIFLILSAGLLGSFGIALHPASVDPRPTEAAFPPRTPFGDTERLIILGSVASLFAIFLILQVSYLFGDPGGRAGSGSSYADAVHRGFVELNIASTLCAVVLFALRRHGVCGIPSSSSRILEWVVTAQAQILLLSAFNRVTLYEGAYGFTRERLYVQVYAAVAFIALILIAIELRSDPRLDRFFRRAMLVGAMAFCGLIWVNSDAWIANANLRRYARTGEIDVGYLTNNLGPDAVPELMSALPHMQRATAAMVETCLRNRYAEYVNSAPLRWFEWSLRRIALQRALVLIRGTASATAPDSGAEAGRAGC
jgi:hypothetical protein